MRKPEIITYNGESKTRDEWCNFLGVKKAYLQYRFSKGLSFEDIVDEIKNPDYKKVHERVRELIESHKRIAISRRERLIKEFEFIMDDIDNEEKYSALSQPVPVLRAA